MKENLFYYAPPTELDVVSSQGSYVTSSDGRDYLDFLSGWCVGNAGWGKKEIAGAVASFEGPTYVLPTYKYSRWEALAEKLVLLMPQAKGTCFKATGGTEAVEIALKIARAHNHRKKFIAFADAYHGQSYACMALVGLHQDKFGDYGSDYIHLQGRGAIDWDKNTQQAVKAIKSKQVCAFICEPILCNLGVIVPPKEFFEQVKDACTQTDTVFIMDEVATGFCRTGKMLGLEHYELQPDIVTMAKGLSSGYGAIGATIALPAIAESMRFEFSNYSTYGWHPLAVEAAIANVIYLQKNKLAQKSSQSGGYFSKLLGEFCDTQGKGLCVGLDTPSDAIRAECFKNGLLIDAFYNRAVLYPPLDVTKIEMDAAAAMLEKSLKNLRQRMRTK